MNYLEIIKYATLAFPIVALLFSLPFVLHEYHKLGAVSFYKSVVVYLFIYYLICAYFLVILPLPKISEVAKLTTRRTQLVPFQFLFDFIKNTSIDIFDIKTYWSAFLESYFYVPVFNIVLTIPFGFFLRYYFEKNLKETVLISFLLSLFFEITQLTGLYFIYPRGYRLFDVDDLILNTVGGMCGYFMSKPIINILPSMKTVNLDARDKGKIISGFRRFLAACVDLLIFLTFKVLVFIFWRDSLYVNVLVFFGYYFLFPVLFNASTLGEKFLNIAVLDYYGKINKSRLILRRLVFIVIYFIVPYMGIQVASLIDDVIIKAFFCLIFIGVYLLIYIISFIKYIFTNKDMIYEKISKTRITSTIK